MTEVSTTIGWISVATAIVTWGLWTIPLKLPFIERLNVDPMISQLYISISIFLSSWLILLYNKFTFTYYGIIGAALWVPGNLFAIVAIKMLGVSVANGLWAGCIILVSFLWGAVVFRDPVKNVWLTALGLVMLCAGIAGIALCKSEPAPAAVEEKHEKVDEEDPHIGESMEVEQEIEVDHATVELPIDTVTASHLSESTEHEQLKAVELNDDIHEEPVSIPTDPSKLGKIKKMLQTSHKFIIGITCCLLIGLLCGSMMVPTRFGPDVGIVYMVSFGIGNIIVTPPITVVYFMAKRQVPQFHLKIALPAFLIAGVFWNIGNFASTYASLSPLGLTVGYPLTQCALVIAGLLGIFVFKEMRGWKPITQFFISALCLLLPGCALLAMFGKA